MCESLQIPFPRQKFEYDAAIRREATNNNPDYEEINFKKWKENHDYLINNLNVKDPLYEAQKYALLLCHPDPSKRPSIAEAIAVLEKNLSKL